MSRELPLSSGAAVTAKLMSRQGRTDMSSPLPARTGLMGQGKSLQHLRLSTRRARCRAAHEMAVGNPQDECPPRGLPAHVCAEEGDEAPWDPEALTASSCWAPGISGQFSPG